MSILLFTGAGLGLGSILGWLIDQKPYFFVSADSIGDQSVKTALALFLFVAGLGLNFYGLGITGLMATRTILIAFLVSISWAAGLFDLYYGLIPNRLIIIGFCGWVFWVFLGSIDLFSSVSAGISSAALILLIRLAGFLFYQKAGMGIGDIKLVFLIGLCVQWEVFWVIYLAILLGGIWAIGGIIAGNIDRQSRLPFAPFLCIAVLIATFFPFDEFVAIWV